MKRYIYILPLLTAILMGCVREEIDTPIPQPESGTAEISFLAETPPSIQITPRGETGTGVENAIENIYVLVFDKSAGTLLYKSRGKILNPVAGSVNNNKWTFKATLPVGTEYTFMVLANAEDKLIGIDVGLSPAITKVDVLALAVSNTGKWNPGSEPFPMWCEKDMNLSATDTPTFEMVRMLARINVDVNLRDIGGQTVDNFELTSVRLYNYNTAGAIVPERNNYDFDTHATQSPTIPSAPGTQTGSAIEYSGSEITDKKSCRGKIYAFEALHNGNTYNNPTGNSNWINNPCLVIGGKYTTPEGTQLGETFYRIDFIRKENSGGNVIDTWLSILRNFSYNVTIVQVDGSGFIDPDVALKSAPINMEANILDWNEDEMGEITFDGSFYLSVSRDRFVVERGAVNQKKDEYVLYVKTDYIFNNSIVDPKSGWYVEKYVDAADGTTEVDWLKLVPERGVPNNRVEAYFEVDENTGSSSREAIVWIAAGRLRYPVYLRQGVISIDITDPDANNNPVSEMIFVIPSSGSRDHDARHFDVSWTPVGQNVTIAKRSPQDWNEFDPSWSTPALTGTIPGGTGSRSYEVKPPAVTDQELGTDPFYQKETTFDFTVSLSGGETQTKGITLRQIYYNLIVDTYTYRLDGKTYNLTVRCNADWKITKVEEWLHDIDPAINDPSKPVFLQLKTSDDMRAGTTGGPDINGKNVSFTVINHLDNSYKNRWGTVYVTFESPDNKFASQRIPIKFIASNSDRLTVAAFGLSLDATRAYSMAPYSSHDNNSFMMMNAQLNFGELPESKVHVAGMDVIGMNVPGVNMGADKLQEFRDIMAKKPDIIVVSYPMILTQEQCNIIKAHVDSGGVAVIFVGGYNENTGSNYGPGQGASTFLKTILEDNSITTIGYAVPGGLNTTGYGDTYKFPEGDQWADNPVLNGPFGDIRGKHWGAHMNSVGFRGSSTTMDQLDVFTWSQDHLVTNVNNYAVGFVHKTKNLLWIGADCFMTGRPRGTTAELYTDPFTLDANFGPVPRSNWRSGGLNYSVDVYNSHAVANIMAWAISRIESN